MAEYKKQYVLDQIKELYRYALEDHEARYSNNWFAFYRHWKNYVERYVDAEDYHSNIGVGLAFPLIEIVHAKLMEPWLQGDSIIAGEAKQEAGVERAPMVVAYVNEVLQNRVRRPLSKISLAMKAALIFGRGTIKHRMRFERPRTILQREAIMAGAELLGEPERLGSVLQWKEQPPTQHFDLEFVDPFNFIIEPGCRPWEANYCFERSYVTTNEAHARMESGEWDDMDLIANSGKGFDQYSLRRLQLSEGWTDQVRSGAMARRPHEVVEFQGRLQVKETRASRPKYADMIVQMVDDKDLAKHGKLSTWNGKPSFITFEPCIDPGNERPIGLIEPVEDLLLEINDFANIAIDNARKILESPLLIDPNMTEQKKIYLGPAEQNFVRNPAFAVKALEMKDLPSSFYQLLGWYNDLIQRISGVSDFFGGLNTSDTERLTKTATGMTLMANLSASRFGPMLAMLDREFYREIAEAIHKTSLQRMTSPESVRMPMNVSQPFSMVGPEDLDLQIDYSFNAKSLDPQSHQRRQDFIDMTKLLGELTEGLMAQGYELDLYETARILMDEFGRGAEAAKIIRQAKTKRGAAALGVPAGAQPNPLIALPGRPQGPPVPAVMGREAA
jgi:hypothetical protein